MTEPKKDFVPLSDDYVDSSFCGGGEYGEVYRAWDKVHNRNVAIKRVRMKNVTQGIPASALREITMLRALSHPYIITLYDVIYKDKKLELVFELMTQDLHHYLDITKSPLDPELARSYMYQIMLALDYCHRHRVIHRDIKPQNMLIDNDGNIKLADFGLARTFTVPMRQYSHDIVTLWYRAPEILLGETHYGLGVDIWSVGTVFAEMLTSKPLFPGDCDIGQLYKIFQIMGTPTEDIWPGVTKFEAWNTHFPSWDVQDWSKVFPRLDNDTRDLLTRMLVYVPEQRISAKSALDHKYFDNIDRELYDA